MEVRLDFQCKLGHLTEKRVESGTDSIRCPQCRRKASLIWVATRPGANQQFSTPVVFWRYKDGRLGVAGRADAKTPKNADRVEAKNMGDYRRLTKELNGHWSSKESRKEEVYQQHLEAQESERRGRLSYAMGQESDPYAREIYRAALDYKREKKEGWTEAFSEAMEYDRRKG